MAPSGGGRVEIC
uniref:Uncharacterized protein n=1 Tax=Arundo donax TaxID=35708 RepID=A0A0A9HIU5_ARUDO